MDVYCNCKPDLIRGLLLPDTSGVEWKRGARQPRGVKIIGRKVVMAGRGTYNVRWEEKKLSIWYQSLIPAPYLNS